MAARERKLRVGSADPVGPQESAQENPVLILEQLLEQTSNSHSWRASSSKIAHKDKLEARSSALAERECGRRVP
eukprot:555370-Amphidinium_carterae.1